MDDSTHIDNVCDASSDQRSEVEPDPIQSISIAEVQLEATTSQIDNHDLSNTIGPKAVAASVVHKTADACNKNLTDLPLEVLTICIQYFRCGDVKNLAITSRRFYELLEAERFRRVFLRFTHSWSPDSVVRPSSWHAFWNLTDGHEFGKRVAGPYSVLPAKIHHLVLRQTRHCEGCEPEQHQKSISWREESCSQITFDFLERIPNLKFLSFDGQLALTKLPVYPKLRFLSVSTKVSALPIYCPIESIEDFLVQPKLEHLELGDITIFPPEIGSDHSGRVFLETLTTLAFMGTSMPGSTLKCILQKLGGGLKELLLWRRKGASVGNLGPVNRITIDALFDAIRKLDGTIERLSLVNTDEEVFWAPNEGIPRDLTSFQKLRKLIIAPEMLINEYICPARREHSTHALIPRNLLASLLPSSLMCLTIVASEYQVRQVPNYVDDILEGFWQDRQSRLQALGTVKILIMEAELDSYRMQCSCQPDARGKCKTEADPRQVRLAERRKRSRIQEFQNLGICLDFVSTTGPWMRLREHLGFYESVSWPV
ncbi:hypothetical protein H2200_009732 [Cladophialophora chaetospira]|uniref:F-box domain-containing protein n=1 Tax=Cladophialophora chaetospira TaxID=386627 RepID=A0AA38X2Y9_9EURO|nr:hypothetical protein H2200_009732 [Cladophialophora chaetospira]